MGKKIIVELYWEDDFPLNRLTAGEKLAEVMYSSEVSMYDTLEVGNTDSSFWSSDGSHYRWEVKDMSENS